MNRSQWIALTSVIILVIGCFMPWVHIVSADITISGVDTSGTLYGKPAYLHFILSVVVLVLTFVKRIWAKRFNLLFAALNFAWALRNLLVLGRCEGGECPEKQSGLYLIVIASAALLITAFFPNMKISPAENDSRSTDPDD